MQSRGEHRICLTLHYDGGEFHGWQLQPELRTVQGELERTVGKLFARPTRVLGAGRTDRGVHALGQVAVVDAPGSWRPGALRRALNSLLPGDIWVADARLAPADFHPRFAAVSRSYGYRLGLAPEVRSPFHDRWCWGLDEPLDVELMRKAAAITVGDHSFRAFAKAGQEFRGDLCAVRVAEWTEWEGLGLEFRITARRFLHHTVRYLVGTLVEIGMGRRPVGDMERLLDADTSFVTSPPAPAKGLFLRAVGYPPSLDWPEGPPPETAALPPRDF